MLGEKPHRPQVMLIQYMLPFFLYLSAAQCTRFSRCPSGGFAALLCMIHSSRLTRFCCYLGRKKALLYFLFSITGEQLKAHCKCPPHTNTSLMMYTRKLVVYAGRGDLPSSWPRPKATFIPTQETMSCAELRANGVLFTFSVHLMLRQRTRRIRIGAKQHTAKIRTWFLRCTEECHS